jgi:hypothetical protein
MIKLRKTTTLSTSEKPHALAWTPESSDRRPATANVQIQQWQGKSIPMTAKQIP